MWRIFLMSIMSWFLWSESKVYAASEAERLILNGGWQFSEDGKWDWKEAQVPGTIHQDLLFHKLLPDPFYGMNEARVQWVEEKDWVYRTTFQLSALQLQRGGALMCFEGLDTYADVYLNGALILKADNMFMGYRIPVLPFLVEGENRMVIRFRSPIRETMPQRESNGFDYPADNDHYPQKLSVFSRKAPYSYGWDWGIRLATSGIWRPVSLELFDVASVEDFHIKQLKVTSEKAELENVIELNQVSGEPLELSVKLNYTCGNQQGKIVRTQLFQPGMNKVSLPLDIDKPKLWMPNGWGVPYLYQFKLTVWKGEVCLAEKIVHTGLRDIQIINERDEHGMSFYFKVNGKPLFAKGANMIPSDALLPRVTPERYIRLLDDVQASNMNMLRIWGGGVYEDDLLYDEADKRGILIWQDFMFACTTYPHDPAFLQNVAQEAEYNIKRLRNHPSLAMWCGNNEIYEGIRYWGWKKKYSEAVYQRMQQGYDVLFKKLLPEIVNTFDSGRFYLEGSPYVANWGRPESWGMADSHNWGIWYGRKPFETLDNEIPRFMSEFGFLAFPEMKTIRTFASPKDYAIDSQVMKAHQKSSIGNELIKQTMGLYYRVPDNFEDLVYMSQVLQGYGIRRGVEAHRRNRPYCMGTLPWQLNDSWPVASWSAIDYFGNWKAMQYQLKRAFSPVLINVLKKEGQLKYYLISDCLEPAQVVVSLNVFDFSGKVHRKKEIKREMPANTSSLIYEESCQDAFKDCNLATSYLQMVVKEQSTGKILSEEVFYPVYPKDQQLSDPSIKLTRRLLSDGSLQLTLKSKQLARDVFVEIPVQGAQFSDNFFDLLPGRSKKIIVSSPDGQSLDRVEIKLHHLR